MINSPMTSGVGQITASIMLHAGAAKIQGQSIPVENLTYLVRPRKFHAKAELKNQIVPEKLLIYFFNASCCCRLIPAECHQFYKSLIQQPENC
ncbi:hypothetical protein [Acinetobacter indicus]|uniref:hypothetical protein n=1 Tax=Acinetobacter indicus TaxID=756892 RepID=UPI0013156341|nr:hypothetical protein [Acinetobacter indicus]